MTKRLVICCDGTWNTPDCIDRDEVCPSNVAKIALAVALADIDREAQLLYDPKGVGTGMGERLHGAFAVCTTHYR